MTTPAPGQIWQYEKDRFRVLAISNGWVFVEYKEHSTIYKPHAFFENASFTYLPDAETLDPADDWVYLPPDHRLRRGVDYFHFDEDGWVCVGVFSGLCVGGMKCRCRRRDQPSCKQEDTLQPPTLTLTTVRPEIGTWWRRRSDNIVVMVTGFDEDGDPEYVEFDAKGDYYLLFDFLKEHTPITALSPSVPSSGHSSVSIDHSGRVSS